MGISKVSRVGNIILGQCVVCYLLSTLIIMNTLDLKNIEEPYTQLD